LRIRTHARASGGCNGWLRDESAAFDDAATFINEEQLVEFAKDPDAHQLRPKTGENIDGLYADTFWPLKKHRRRLGNNGATKGELRPHKFWLPRQ